MAASLQDWSDFQNDLIQTYQTLFGFSTPTLAELTGATVGPDGVATHDPARERITPLSNAGREVFIGGAEIRVPIQVAEVPGAAGVGRAGTWPVTAPMSTGKAVLSLCELVVPVGLDLALERDAKNGVYTARSYVETLTESAYRSLAMVENKMLHGDGTGKLADIASATGSGTLVVPTDPATTNYDNLTPGLVVSIFTKADGSNPGNGDRRKIVSVDRVTGDITFDTAAVADDGDNGNITFSSAEGIYIDSTWDDGTLGKATQGLGQVVTTPGTAFEGIDVANVGNWTAAQVDASTAALDDPFLDEVVYRLAGNGVAAPDFAVAHPRTVDPYKATKTQFLMVQPQEAVVPSGFRGIVYQGANKEFPIIKDLSAPRKVARVITKSAVRYYGDSVGPDFIRDDNSMWRFFERRSYKEATVMDRPQFGVHNPSHLAEIVGLTE